MHELSICRSLIREADAVVREAAATAVLRVRVRVGPLSGVEPALLLAAWDAGRAGTRFADALLDVERAEIVVRCRECNHLGPAEPADLRCRRCGAASTTLSSGDECLLIGVDLTVLDPVAPAPGARDT
jgi:hydrogenase nickel incorporation protein HypA/HybF